MQKIRQNCEPEAVAEYIKYEFQPRLAELQRKQNIFTKKYAQVKNDYTMARVCTFKLMKALNGMDATLDKISLPQRQTAATPND